MELLTLALVSIVSCLIGGVAAWIAGGSKHRRELDGLEADMRAELDERHAVHDELEQRVKRIVKAFDRHEQEFERRLANQCSSIEELKRALAQHEDFAAEVEARAEAEQHAPARREMQFVEKAKDTDFLGLPDDGQPLFGGAGSDVFDALSQMDEWEQRVETVSGAQHTQIDDQSREIERLTDKVRKLEPLSATVYKREVEIEQWKQRYEELECALSLQAQALEGVVSELRPKAAELSDHESAERTLRERFEARLSEQVGQLESREQRIEGLTRELEAAHEHIDELTVTIKDQRTARERAEALVEEQLATLAERDARIDELAEELTLEQGEALRLRTDLERGAGELETARARTRELEAFAAEVDELRAASRRLAAEVEQQADLIGSLRDEIAAQSTELALRDEEREQIETLRHEHLRAQSRIDDLRKEADATARELGELTALHDGLRTKNEWLTRSIGERQAELAARDEEVARLGGEVGRLQDDLVMARGSLDGQTSKIGDLMRELDHATSRVRSRNSALSQAHDLLENLRPMIESLETTLHEGDEAQA
jgi:chromosome segregation ATPase